MTDLTQPIITDDEYYNSVYNKVRSDLNLVLANITVTDDKKSVADLFGEELTDKIVNILVNETVTPLINALANLHKTTQVIDLTTYKVLQTDMVLHRMPDIFLFNQQLAALRDSCNIYFDARRLHAQYPIADGWTHEISMVEQHAVELDKEAGVEYGAEEAPLRNINISVVMVDGSLREQVRYCNFTYTDAKTNTQEITDIPAFWDEAKSEFLISSAIGLIRLRDSSLIADGINVTGGDIQKAYGNPVVAENDAVTRAIFEANHADNTTTPK